MQSHKKLFAALAMAGAVTAFAGSAQAHTNVQLSIGAPVYYQPVPVYAPPPVYYAPAPVYYEPAPVYIAPGVGYYHGRDRHRHYDWGYWQRGHDNHGHR